jgi:GxxExxY protein
LYKHSELTERVIAAFYDVYNSLGYGFLEKVYENALAVELCERGHAVEQQRPIQVCYRQTVVGEYVADVVVDGRVLLEIKAARTLAEEHEAQLLNYLKATPYEVGLLLNFGPKPQVRRKAYNNERKPNLKRGGDADERR